MEINHSGIVAEQERYKYAVKANNKSNTIIFKFSKQQDSIALDPNKHFYVKVQNSGKTFTDKDPNVVVTSDEKNVFISWTMLRKVTAYKNIDVQVQYEDEDVDIVWQSAIVNIDLFQTIPADKEIEDKYPSILMAHQQKLDEFERRIKALEDAPAPTHVWGGITGDIHDQTDLMEIIKDINSAISSEATARINADTTLHNEIEAEKTARQNDVRGIEAELGEKVDKVEGKGLSTNDYTTEEKAKLNGVEPQATKVVVLASTPNGYVVINGIETRVYDDTELREQIGGKTASWVIDSQSQITGDKDAYENYTNVTAIEGLALELLKVGDNIYVRDNAQPDYWVDSKIVVEGQVILALRAFDTKTDLSQYPTRDEVAALLDNKVNKVPGSSLVPDTKVANYDNHIINKQNPHEVTKQQVGLGEVDNKSEATIKEDFTGAIEEGNEGFVKGKDAFNAISGMSKSLISITYNELKELRDNGKLIPGQQYRITDYECTTSQFETKSAGHKFDIIVIADDEKTLNENARAIKHEFETPIIEVKIYYHRNDEFIGDYLTFLDDYEFNGQLCGRWVKHENGVTDGEPRYIILNARVVDGQLDKELNEIEQIANIFVDDEEVEYPIEDEEPFGSHSYSFDRIEVIDISDYFKNCHLESWQLKYCLDNDVSRFSWALTGRIKAIKVYETEFDFYIHVRYPEGDQDGKFAWAWVNDSDYSTSFNDVDLYNFDSSDLGFTDTEDIIPGETIFEYDGFSSPVIEYSSGEGKGVIFYMKDEWNNECPYDFKNIQFKRCKVTVYDEKLEEILDNWDWAPSKYIAFTNLENNHINEYDRNDCIWAYTFTTNKYDDVTAIVDASLNNKVEEIDMDDYFMQYCHNNIIKSCYNTVTIDDEIIRSYSSNFFASKK